VPKNVLIRGCAICRLIPQSGVDMGRTRDYFEKLLFPGAHGQRRRHMRFFLLALVLGAVIAIAIGAMFIFLNSRARSGY
jgi:hypothetical protein